MVDLLPKLKKIDKSGKKHIYKLKNSSHKRRLAIDEGIQMESKTKKNIKQAAHLEIFNLYLLTLVGWFL